MIGTDLFSLGDMKLANFQSSRKWLAIADKDSVAHWRGEASLKEPYRRILLALHDNVLWIASNGSGGDDEVLWFQRYDATARQAYEAIDTILREFAEDYEL